MSLESAPDRSYDVPPADERKGKAKAEGDRYLGNPIVTHRFTVIRYPADTMAPPRQENVVGMNYKRRPGWNLWCARTCVRTDSRGGAHAVARIGWNQTTSKPNPHQRPS